MRSDDDPLIRATRALREETRGDPVDANATRRQIVERLGHRARRRTRASVFVLAFAALLSASTVWAARGGRLSGVFERFRRATPSAPDEREIPSNEPAHDVAPEPGMATPTPTPTSTVAPAVTTTFVVAPHSPSPRATRSLRATDREDDLFAAATHAHFDLHDPSAALAAWDAYLDAAPAGRFALEARYNRALCLLRLGRRSEAIAELTPYAKGVHGSYRQHEAEQLIAALSREAP